MINPIKIPIYNWNVIQLIGSKEDAEAYISGLENVNITPIEYGEQDAGCYQYNSDIYVWHPIDAPITVMCHEVAHATFYLMNTIGLDIRDQEAFCYLFEYILEECLKRSESCTLTDQNNQVLTQEDTQQ